MAPRAKFFVVRGVLVDGVAHAAEAQPAEPHRGPPEDDLRGGARLQELEGMCGAGILLKDSAVLQLHDVVLLDVVLLGHVVVGRVRQLEESGGRVRPEGQGPHGGCRARCALRNSFRSRFSGIYSTRAV